MRAFARHMTCSLSTRSGKLSHVFHSRETVVYALLECKHPGMGVGYISGEAWAAPQCGLLAGMEHAHHAIALRRAVALGGDRRSPTQGVLPMSFSMSQASLPVFEISLNALSAVLEKAEAYAAAKGIDSSVLLNSRLYPDMFALVSPTRSCAIAALISASATFWVRSQ